MEPDDIVSMWPSKDSEEGGVSRYAAFGLRMKQLFAAKASALASKASVVGVKAKAAAAANMRYTAYSSDIGEAFRPVVPQWAVKATYGLAITYIAGEVGVATYKESKKPEGETARTFVHACVFQGLASLAIPMVAIHQLVHAAQSLTKRVGRFQKWGPTIAGLAFIPALPFVIDEPAEHVIDTVFEKVWPSKHGGHGASHGAHESDKEPVGGNASALEKQKKA